MIVASFRQIWPNPGHDHGTGGAGGGADVLGCGAGRLGRRTWGIWGWCYESG